LRCYKFNQPVNNLPKTLTHLTFLAYYNKGKFNQPLENLPESLTFLQLDVYKEFNNNILIPKNCKTLIISIYNKIIDNIPEHVEKLYITNIFRNNKKYVSNLPVTLKEVIVEDENSKKFIKMPFGTLITIDKNV
jgi:hypothetical protein